MPQLPDDTAFHTISASHTPSVTIIAPPRFTKVQLSPFTYSNRPYPHSPIVPSWAGPYGLRFMRRMSDMVEQGQGVDRNAIGRSNELG